MKHFKISSNFKNLATVIVAILFSISMQAQTNVFDNVIASSADHTYLKAALEQENLDAVLQDPSGDFTVFAPTNTAFDSLASKLNTTIAGLLALPNLSDILLYHVLTTSVSSGAITNGQIESPVNSVNTLKLTKTSMGAVFVNQAQVNGADLNTMNGIVHSIDAVLLSGETVADVAINNGFTTLTTAVIQQELLPSLTDPFATYTVFAPSNQAFDDLAGDLGTNIAGLLALPNLTDILLYHVMDVEVASTNITNGTIANALSPTNTLKITKTSMGDVYINQAKVTTPDITSDNGIVHVLDNVILPVETVADIAIDNNFTTLTTAVIQEELLPALTDPLATLTVFAPSNQAFDDLASALGTNIAGLLALPNLTDILLYHAMDVEVASANITNGTIANALSPTNTLKITKTSTGDVFINQAKVTTPDITSDNGIVHVLNKVILPVETVADVAIDNGFTTLTTAVIQEELLPALTDPLASFTVFAPTDQAFVDLANDLNTTVSGLLALPNLTDILLYHVLGTEILANALTNGPLTTLNGQTVNVDLTSGVMINSSNVTMADVTSDNGVVHEIDKVLLPSATGINEAQGAIEIQTYPNPAKDLINFRNITNGNYEILNAYGAVVMQGNVSSNTIDISSIPSGPYFIRILGDDNIYQTRILKM